MFGRLSKIGAQKTGNERQGNRGRETFPGKIAPLGALGNEVRDRAAVVSLDGQGRVALEIARNRLILAASLIALAFSVISFRVFDLTVLQAIERHPVSATDFAKGDGGRSPRADIRDRNGVLLATSLPTFSLFAQPRKIPDAANAARRVVEVLPSLNKTDLLKKFRSNRSFVWVQRNLTPRQQYAVNRLGIPGLDFEREDRRFYPKGRAAAHVIGFTDIDGQGLSGLEKSFDDMLSKGGESLNLSIDVRIQHILSEEMQKAMEHFEAIGAAGLIMDVKTGEILASSSLPGFDANDPADASESSRFNRVSLGVYEMGSTFKALTTAMALEEGVVSLMDGYDVSEPIKAASFRIHDYRPRYQYQWLSVPEILIYSSNIGTAKMAIDLGSSLQRRYLADFGMLKPATTELGEVGRPLIPSPWREINTMTISYGHGLAVSPLQLANAFSAVVNGGIMRPATFLKRKDTASIQGRRVISESTSRKMRDLLRLVVLHGSGRNADVEGYLVGGKSGTAEKLEGDHYAGKKRISSFVASFPMNDPQYVVYVMVDEPKGQKSTYGYATGGWVAAPVVKSVISRTASLLGVTPSMAEELADEERNTMLKQARTEMEGRPVAYRP